jgi:hypothetical protein
VSPSVDGGKQEKQEEERDEHEGGNDSEDESAESPFAGPRASALVHNRERVGAKLDHAIDAFNGGYYQ